MASDPRALALRAALALPSPILRALSGGAVVHVGGRTLDPRLQFLGALTRASPSLSGLSPEEARARAAEAQALLKGAPRPDVAIEKLRIPGPAGTMAARLYRPLNLALGAPFLVFAHGGGGVTGDLDTHEDLCALLAAEAGWPVVSVDYRLAPEHRYPAALEDFLAACAWARDAAETCGAGPGRIAVGGESFGATLAAAACQAFRRLGAMQPVLQLLVCPLLDAVGDQPSMTLYGRAWPLSSEDLVWFMGHTVDPGASPADPGVSPLRAADFSGLAPAVIACAGFDPLLDQGEAYARKLKDAGIPVIYRCYDSLAHGFGVFLNLIPGAKTAAIQVARLARDLAGAEAF
jgi:acetyl esterase/lipase